MALIETLQGFRLRHPNLDLLRGLAVFETEAAHSPEVLGRCVFAPGAGRRRRLLGLAGIAAVMLSPPVSSGTLSWVSPILICR
jgi:hypothetical protein